MPTWEELYVKHYSEILNYINFKIGNLHNAEDIASTVFLKVNDYLSTFDAEKSSVTTWLRNIANTCIVDYFRGKNGNFVNRVNKVSDFVTDEGKEIFQFHADDNTETLAERNEFKSRLAKSFAKMKPKYRRIATLYFLREKEYSEIAEICQVPMGTVKGMINRCREKLQNELQGIKGEYYVVKA